MDRNLLSGFDDVDLAQHLIAEFHDDMRGRIGRLHMLTYLSWSLGIGGAMLPGGTISYRAWTEARQCFINGLFVATVQLCQALMENLLASEMESRLNPIDLPDKATAKKIRAKSREARFISEDEERDLECLENLRNPLTHYRNTNDPGHIDQRAMQEDVFSDSLLERDAVFAITTAMRMVAKPSFCLKMPLMQDGQ